MQRLFTATGLAALFLAVLLAAPSMALADAQGKKALVIVAKSNFSAAEYSKTCSALKSGGMTYTVASTSAGPCKGDSGKQATAELALSQAQAADYDAVVIIGGNGIMQMWQNPDALRLVQDAVAQDKVVAAICAGPGILAHAGVLKGKRATAYSGKPSSTVKEHGGEYTGKKVEVDGKIITGNGPKAASNFGRAIVAAFD